MKNFANGLCRGLYHILRKNIFVFFFLAAMSIVFLPWQIQTAVPNITWASSYYSTDFSSLESGKWLNGKTNGLDWTNVTTVGGNAVGTMQGKCDQSSPQTNTNSCYDDSIASMTGNWNPDQKVEAIVYSQNPSQGSDPCNQEVELHLRTSISNNYITTYEILLNVRQSDWAYTDIVKWPGYLGRVIGDFKGIGYKQGWSCGVNGNEICGVKDGDRVKVEIKTQADGGVKIDVYKMVKNSTEWKWFNGATDYNNPNMSGNPGVGFYWGRVSCGEPGTNGRNISDYGFTDFTATDALGGAPPPDTTPPATPTGLTVM